MSIAVDFFFILLEHLHIKHIPSSSIYMINVKQAAELLNESVSKIRTLIKNNILIGKKVGKSYQISEESVTNYRALGQQNMRKFDANTKGIWGELRDFPPVMKLCDGNITKFWDDHCEKLSKDLPLLPKETMSTAGYVTETKLTGDMPNLSAKICAEPHMEYTKTTLKTKTIQLYPQKEIRALWLMWTRETSRIYNSTLNLLEKLPNAKTIGEYTLRDIVKAEININPTYPNTALEGAINEARLAFKAGKPKERVSGAFDIDGRCIKKGYIYLRNTKQAFGKDIKANPIKRLRKIITKRICTISHNEIKGCFNLHIPIEINPIYDVKKQFVSLDPGIRTFMTYYDGETYGEIGAGFAKSLGPLMEASDKLHSKINQTKNKRKREAYQKARGRITKKITNKVKDLHYQTAKFLGKYENIFLPEFRVKPLAEKLGIQTTRELYALSHFKFKQHLAFKTAEFGNRVIICNEAYTSKTCTNCGRIHPDLGADKIYNCICGICHDRDYNGARNIALRVLTYGLTHANHIN